MTVAFAGLSALALPLVLGRSPATSGRSAAGHSAVGPTLAPSFSAGDLRRPDGRVGLLVPPGRPTVVSFFASWCDPCRRGLPVPAAARAGPGGAVALPRRGRLLLARAAAVGNALARPAWWAGPRGGACPIETCDGHSHERSQRERTGQRDALGRVPSAPEVGPPPAGRGHGPGRHRRSGVLLPHQAASGCPRPAGAGRPQVPGSVPSTSPAIAGGGSTTTRACTWSPPTSSTYRWTSPSTSP